VFLGRKLLNNDALFYKDKSGKVKIEVLLKDEDFVINNINERSLNY